MEPHRNDLALAAELRGLRSSPRPAFVAELDARVDAGFPRRGTGRAGATLNRAMERLRATPPRRLLAPASAVTVLAIGIATAVVTTSDRGSTSSSMSRVSDPAETGSRVPGQLEEMSRSGWEGSASSNDSSGPQYAEPLSAKSAGEGPNAFGAAHRDIERSTQIVLGTDPSDLRANAAKVFDAVHAADGIVLRSSIRDGAAGEAVAEFDLLIPSSRLGDALAAFSAIAEIRSRQQSTQDITAPTISAGERLQEVRAKVEGLLAQLADADTDGERVAVEAELRAAQRQRAALRSRLTALQRRANLSQVSLRIETGAAAAGDGDEGAWGASDALDDAGRILAVAAGITIVALAILAPLALVLFLAWLAHRRWVRRDRQRALGA